MNDLAKCPKCNSEYTYEDGYLTTCSECFHTWNESLQSKKNTETLNLIKDANGTPLKEGDSITIIKNLKVKGASSDLKIGTKVKNIKLVDGDHNIECKIKGFGDIKLKSEFVKKV